MLNLVHQVICLIRIGQVRLSLFRFCAIVGLSAEREVGDQQGRSLGDASPPDRAISKR